MDAGLIAAVLLKRRRLARHERWTGRELRTHQSRAFQRLRRYALERSPFYRRFHHGLEDAPLGELPVLSKAELMSSFNDVVTDRAIRLGDIERYLLAASDHQRFLGRYWVARTAGSTGTPGLFLASRDEWSTIIASYARAQEWAGIHASLTRMTRLAVVSSLVRWHQSARVGLSVDSIFLPVRRFDATQPIAEIVSGLNSWKPENLIAYASMAKSLAQEQLAGRLRIHPKAVMCASEVLTAEAKALIERAWGHAPYNVYGATETAAIASDCSRHRLHVYEDLVITEVVDETNRPVPAGTLGAKVLVTVLFSRTQPLIRYELSDCVAESTGPCECGLGFRLIDAVEGRLQDVLTMPGRDGNPVRVHPNVFHRVFEAAPVRAWQVVQEEDGLRVFLSQPRPELDERTIIAALDSELQRVGAKVPPVTIERVEAIRRSALGKAPLVVGRQRWE